MSDRDDLQQANDAPTREDRPRKAHPHRGRAGADAALLAALAGGATHEEAARLAGVSPATVTRRLRDRAFRQQLADARRELVQQALGVLTAASAGAARTLAELCGPALPKVDEALEPTPPAARIAAAKAILELGSKLRQEIDIDDRLKRVEETISQTAQAGRAGPHGRGGPTA